MEGDEPQQHRLLPWYNQCKARGPAKVAAEGEFLNQRLLDEGLVVRYEG